MIGIKWELANKKKKIEWMAYLPIQYYLAMCLWLPTALYKSQ